MAKVLILAAAVLLAACSSLSLGVRWADTIALSRIDDYFNLRGADADRARKEFRETWGEVRRTVFPQLAGRLEEWAAQAESGRLDRRALLNGFEVFKEDLRAAYLRFEPLGQRLVAEQVGLGFDRFDEAVAANLAKKEKRWADADERRDFAFERLERVVKETVGRLTTEQKAWAEAALEESPPPLVEQEKSRRALWERFRALRGNEAARKKLVTDFFARWETLQTPAYLAARAKHDAAMRELAAKIWAAATPEQKAQLVKNFRGRAAELRDLSQVSR